MSFKTTCPYCGVGCGIEITRTGSVLKLTGDKESPVNQGMLCIKGQTLLETVGTDDDRLLNPSLGSWEKTIQAIAQIFSTTPKHQIALYISGQMLMEDFYVAKKFANAYGIDNLESNSRLCMYSTVEAHKRAYGADIVPVSFDDIYQAQTIFIIGSNTADCHPIVFNHIKKSKAFVVCVDVYESTTAQKSDLFIQVEPGKDMDIINNLPNQPWFKDKKVLSIYSQGITQSTDATDKVNALINVHIVTGNINKPGCGVLSLTGQCNAMGGREIGIKTSDLTATEFFSSNQIKTLWVMATNPAHSMINYRQFNTLIVSDFTKTLTTKDADIVLPACSWSEKTGHIKNSERRYLQQNAFLPPAGKSKPDWKIICLVAKELGLDGFDYQSADDIWKQMNIDDSWQPNIQVREELVEIKTPHRVEHNSVNNIRLLTQWHSMSRTGKSETLNKMTQRPDKVVSIHHISNTNFFKNKKVELDKYSKQPCFKG
ncbi:Assimilatory nitrate reductase large subunit (EC 1.7.99.4) [uncultured Gammaproteobacteria bacterium]|uniref:molybdopterin oxidoreductase family protein n=1 Tax=Bathymodiolus heckerae thiotrophic gill symbiont TaxID=1052212 RepID=UPI0010B53869|nr:molybdopterin-dependent oxidoreductase [Bathymodiolus heckerae thiotrophic gill symbiont]CAC9445141.1 Assimilatory nitrate reductase large subunit (EC 1.7.99.4) [uncultured Gammaproteobacteria bacterium]SMN14021.1 Assimilatory nitrate reductase large subunit [Bathymodiolus heckerae thiotrophic gill symbiont]